LCQAYDFAANLARKGVSLWTEDLLKIDADSKELKPNRAKIFHTSGMKGVNGILLWKRG
jgi:hypothetical protein